MSQNARKYPFALKRSAVHQREYPAEWHEGDEPYYPVNNEHNDALFKKYQELAGTKKHIIFGGRLGQYKYYDMDKVIEAALEAVAQET